MLYRSNLALWKIRIYSNPHKTEYVPRVVYPPIMPTTRYRRYLFQRAKLLRYIRLIPVSVLYAFRYFSEVF